MQKAVVRRHHNDEFTDNYEWMRDKDDPSVIAHLDAENAYTDERTAHLEPLRERLFSEIRSRVQETDLSVPSRHGSWWYYTRTFEGKQYGVQCRAPLSSVDDWTPPVLEADIPVPGEEIIFDSNVEAEGHEFFSVGSFDVSDDGALLLYGVDLEGDERYTLRIREIASGRELSDEIRDTAAGAEFSPDAQWVMYSSFDDKWRSDTLWCYRVGVPGSETVIFHEADERFSVGGAFTRSKKYLLVMSSSSQTSEWHFAPADDPLAPLTPVWERTQGVEYAVDHAEVAGEDLFYIIHNDNALDFELVHVPVAAPSGPRTVVLPHAEGTRIIDIDCFRDFATVAYRSGGLERVGILDYASGTVREIAFEEPLYTASFGGNAEWAPPVVRLGYTSFVTPSSVYDYDIASGVLHLRKQQQVRGGFSPEDYDQQRLWAKADDGTLVPISLVWKRSFGQPGDSARPVHLYGYGSYEASIDPVFSVLRLSMLDRGVIFAVAHVRGGGEMGRHWYEQGKELHKRNTFTDFIACAQHLVTEGVTAPEKMVAEGGSAGGLLMGAVANLAPEMFRGIVASVPFVDALTSILDETLPLTIGEWEEWGDPLHNADVYEYMKSYSPYENVHEGIDYPKILAVTSLNDTRVLYVEPAKWVARLREVGADALLKCEMVAGHGGVSGRYNSWRERAFELAWILDTMGLASE